MTVIKIVNQKTKNKKRKTIQERAESIKKTPHSTLEKQLIQILEGGPKTRDQMVKKTGIPRTTVYNNLEKLIIRKEVKKFPLYPNERARGRPKIIFQLSE